MATETRKVYDVQLTHELGTRGTVSRNVRLLAADEDDARASVRYYRKNYETVGDVTLVRASADGDNTAGTDDHNRRV